MTSNVRRNVAGLFLVAGLVFNGPAASSVSAQTAVNAPNIPNFCQALIGAERFARTELFFGLSKPDGSVISEVEFQGFVDGTVTPLFPDGLTLLSGTGQFRGSSGEVIKEGSKLLVLLYTFSRESSVKVEQVREAYKSAFQQQSVLRVDEPSCVSF